MGCTLVGTESRTEAEQETRLGDLPCGLSRTVEALKRLEEELLSRLPEWRTTDRVALAQSLGYGEVSRGNTGASRIALTFDAGSGGAHTPAILDALEAAGVKATFFITGQYADEYPDLVRRMAAEGHEFGNHSYTHPRFTTISGEEMRSQITRTEAKVVELTGLSTVPYFRFPYGARNSGLIRQVNAEGYMSIFWTVDTLDWMPEKTCEEVRSRVMSRACPGAIVLMHCNSPQEAQVLPAIISDLTASGYQVVTLTEVLSP